MSVANTYNYFGAAVADVVERFIGATSADMGGDSVIEKQLARSARLIGSALSSRAFDAIARPEKCMIIEYAQAGQTAVTLPVTPVIANSVHLWALPKPVRDETGRISTLPTSPVYLTNGPYPAFVRDSLSNDTGRVIGFNCAHLIKGAGERPHTVDDLGTGAITLDSGLSAGDMLFASWECDVNDANFSLPSLADLTSVHAAAVLGANLYSRDNQLWDQVQDLRDRANVQLEVMRDGEWVPDEFRHLKWCQDIEPRNKGNSIQTIGSNRG